MNHGVQLLPDRVIELQWTILPSNLKVSLLPASLICKDNHKSNLQVGRIVFVVRKWDVHKHKQLCRSGSPFSLFSICHLKRVLLRTSFKSCPLYHSQSMVCHWFSRLFHTLSSVLLIISLLNLWAYHIHVNIQACPLPQPWDTNW